METQRTGLWTRRLLLSFDQRSAYFNLSYFHTMLCQYFLGNSFSHPGVLKLFPRSCPVIMQKLFSSKELKSRVGPILPWNAMNFREALHWSILLLCTLQSWWISVPNCPHKLWNGVLRLVVGSPATWQTCPKVPSNIIIWYLSPDDVRLLFCLLAADGHFGPTEVRVTQNCGVWVDLDSLTCSTFPMLQGDLILVRGPFKLNYWFDFLWNERHLLGD